VGVGFPLDRGPNNAINALALSPDGQFAVVGHEGGGLFRFDLATLGQVGPVNLGTNPRQGPVESLAYSSPDGRLLAVGIKGDRADTIDPMTMACDMEIRAMPAGNLLQRWRVAGLIYASAFSPGGDRLAYSAGPAQSIYLQDTGNLQKPPDELRGKGSTPFDLGFSRDSRVVGFTRVPFDPSRPPPTYEAFDLGQRNSRNVRREDLTFGLRTYNGWSLRGNIRDYVLELVSPDGRRTPLDLNKDTERNWWSWTFLPPGPGHPQPTVAIGCESGVVIYDLATGQRTRVFAGHSSPVVSLAPSPDGHWLASSSLDQTIMLYRLAGCDTRPGLGAVFRQRRDGFWEVARTEPGGFASAMGLVPGDTIVRAGVQRGDAPPTMYNRNEEITQFVARVDQLAPQLDTIAVWASRMILLPPPIGILSLPVGMLSTKRDNPALTLMLGADKEWIVWTPRGFYDTSIRGDSRYLGWHINADYRSARPTDFFPIGTYAGTMYRKDVLDRIWGLEEVAQAGPPVYTDQPPKIVFTSVEQGVRLPAPGVVWLVSVPNPKLGLSISAEGPTAVARRRVTFDERLLDLRPLAAPALKVTEEIQVELFPRRRVRLAVEAANQSGKERKETIDLVYEPPPPVKVPEPPHPDLIVVGIGNEKPRDPGPLPGILHADRDARDVAEFLSAHLVSADGARGRQDPRRDRIVLTGEKAFARSVGETLERLEQRLQAKQIQRGSIVAVMINSHVLDFDSGARIATTDTKQGAEPMVPARDVSDLLGRLGDYGCRVMVFLDGVHDLPDKKLKNDVKPWVRELFLERRVITFVASKEGPSRVDRQHGVFAQGILDVFEAAGAAAVRKDRAAAFTLEEFREALHQGVQDFSGRMQEADAYIPEEIESWTPFAQP
jgi:WD40 repeat protein